MHVLARAGAGPRRRRRAGARTTFERALAYANDVGLLAEEVDPGTGELLGNFPQAFSHIGLVNAAWAIAQAGILLTLDSDTNWLPQLRRGVAEQCVLALLDLPDMEPARQADRHRRLTRRLVALFFGLVAALSAAAGYRGHASTGCAARGVTLPLGVAILLAVAGFAAHVLPPVHLMRTRRRQRYASL